MESPLGFGNDSLEVLAWTLSEHLAQGGEVASLAAFARRLNLHEDAQRAMEDVVQAGLGIEQVWLVLAHWVNVRANGLADALLAARLQPHVAALDAALLARATEIFERHLAHHANAGWTPSRADRLRQAMGR